MPSAAISAAAASATHHLDHSLRSLGLDLTNVFRTFDLHTISLLGLIILAGILLFETVTKGTRPGYGTNYGTSYGSYGRTGIASAESSHLEPSVRSRYVSIRCYDNEIPRCLFITLDYFEAFLIHSCHVS